MLHVSIYRQGTIKLAALESAADASAAWRNRAGSQLLTDSPTLSAFSSI